MGRHRPAHTLHSPRALLAASLAATLLLVRPVAAPAAPEDLGYAVEHSQELGPGVSYARLANAEGPVVAHVVTLARAEEAPVRTVLSDDRLNGPLSETTSSMCRRVGCLVAVNGDFAMATGQPVGGMAGAGLLLRSPVPAHLQFSSDAAGLLSAGVEPWIGQLRARDGQTLPVLTYNRERYPDSVALYTAEFGPSTATAPGGIEVVLEPVGPLRSLAGPDRYEVVSVHDGAGDTPIPDDGAVLSAEGSGAGGLRAFLADAPRTVLGRRVLLQVDIPDAPAESIGGIPRLLQDGQVVVAGNGQSFVTARHPRTFLGWNDSELLLVAVDGRQPGYSVGINLPDAAALLASLGAREGINLDGGGSTTMVVGGEVVNRPSDRLVMDGATGEQRVVASPRPDDIVLGHVERPATNALSVPPAPDSQPFARGLLEGVPSLVAPPAGTEIPDDPASQP